MKKIIVLASALCVYFTVSAQTPQSAKEAAQAAQEACSVWGRNAAPANNNNYSGVIYYENNGDNRGSNSSNVKGEVEGKAKAGFFSLGAKVGGSYNKTESEKRETKSTGSLYYNCE